MVCAESKRAMTSMGENRCMSNENSTLRLKATINKDGTEPGQISFRQDQDKAKVRSSDSLLPMNESDTRPDKRRKLLLDGQKKVPKKGEDIDGKAGNASDKMVPELAGNRGAKTHAQFLEVTRRPDAVSPECFKLMLYFLNRQRLIKIYIFHNLIFYFYLFIFFNFNYS